MKDRGELYFMVGLDFIIGLKKFRREKIFCSKSLKINITSAILGEKKPSERI